MLQHQGSRLGRRCVAFALLLVSLCAALEAKAASSTVVISQVYAAGGNSGASYNAEYVELFNLCGSNVNIT